MGENTSNIILFLHKRKDQTFFYKENHPSIHMDILTALNQLIIKATLKSLWFSRTQSNGIFWQNLWHEKLCYQSPYQGNSYLRFLSTARTSLSRMFHYFLVKKFCLGVYWTWLNHVTMSKPFNLKPPPCTWVMWRQPAWLKYRRI